MQPATAILSVVLTFILTGVAANWLVHKWQHRNWLRQQQFLGQEKDYQALKELFDEITHMTGKRLSRMSRLLAVLNRKEDEIIRARLKDYDDALCEWNEKLNSFFVKLTMYAGYDMTNRLETDIHKSFVSQGAKLENQVRKRLEGQAIRLEDIVSISDRLNDIQGILFSFNRDMLARVERQQEKTYHGVELHFSEGNLHLFPTWQLIKALFVARVESLSIVCTAPDLRRPGSRGS